MKSGYKKLQFDFAQSAVDRLDKLVKDTGAMTRAEIVRNALRLYEFTNKKLREGCDLRFTKDGVDEIIVSRELIGIDPD